MQNRLQTIIGAIELGDSDLAISRVLELSRLIAAYTGTPEQERVRQKLEDEHEAAKLSVRSVGHA